MQCIFHGVLAVLHGVEGDRHVHIPAGGVVDDVDRVGLAHGLVSLRAGELEGLGLAVGLEPLLLGGDTLGTYVAKSRNFSAGNGRDAVHGARPAHAETHKTDAHLLESRRGIALHRAADGKLHCL